MDLETHQLELLTRLVTAQRSTPPAERHLFLIAHTMSDRPGVELFHPAISHDAPRVFEGDVHTLERMGVVAFIDVNGHEGFYVTNAGFKIHDRLMMGRGESHQRVQAVIREYLESSDFRARHPRAFDRWREAEGLLWNDNADNSATTIGHLSREAMQEFVTSLVDRFRPDNVEPDKAKTVSRLRTVLQTMRGALDERTSAVLDALVVYYGALSDLVQRQEHGGQKEGVPLTWQDSRRVVFQLAVVMFEVDSALRLGSPAR